MPLPKNLPTASKIGLNFVKAEPKPTPESKFVINIWPNEPYFVWHPSGPGYDNLMFGVKFVDGRVPGAVTGQKAMQLKALGCRVEPYEPGKDIADWNKGPDGNFYPIFTTDKPAEKPKQKRRGRPRKVKD